MMSDSQLDIAVEPAAGSSLDVEPLRHLSEPVERFFHGDVFEGLWWNLEVRGQKVKVAGVGTEMGQYRTYRVSKFIVVSANMFNCVRRTNYHVANLNCRKVFQDLLGR